MSAFDSTLRQVEERLDLPAEVRRRVLLDLAADLEGLRQAALEAGLDEAAAHVRALEFVDLSEEAVAALASELAPAPRRWLEGLSNVARSRGERVALLFVALAMLQLGGALFASGGVTRSAGALSWVSLGVLFVSLQIGAVCTYRYRVASDERSTPLLRAATWSWRLSAVQLGIGVIGLASATLRASALLAQDTSQEFESVPGSVLSAGLREQLLLLQSEAALLSLVGLGALTAMLLAQRLASRARRLGTAEQQLRADWRGTPAPSSPEKGNQIPCSS